MTEGQGIQIPRVELGTQGFEVQYQSVFQMKFCHCILACFCNRLSNSFPCSVCRYQSWGLDAWG